jgi:oxygen-independent coproporphyrinogen-3 oxidase
MLSRSLLTRLQKLPSAESTSARSACVSRRFYEADPDRKNKPPKKVAVYIHWPFCKSICPYCDFNRYLAEDDAAIPHERMKTSIIKELDRFLQFYSEPITISSIFFGGGTPSLAKPATFKEIVSHLRGKSRFADDIEISMEANPTSFEAEKFKQFREAGIERLSLGIQSLIPEDLKYLGRNHTAEEATRVIQQAKGIFPRVSFDLIYSRHDKQTGETWRKELQHALSYGTTHLSLYNLTIEPGTAFHNRYKEGKITLPSEEVQEELYNISVEEAASAGLVQYEVSNFAKPGHESRHNLAYWRGWDYIGVGPGASSRVTTDQGRYSLIQLKHPSKWMDAVQNNGSGTAERTQLSLAQTAMEIVMMGLRINEGVKWSTLAEHGVDMSNRHEFIDADALERYANEGLFVIDSEGFRTTPKGRIVLDSLLPLVK